MSCFSGHGPDYYTKCISSVDTQNTQLPHGRVWGQMKEACIVCMLSNPDYLVAEHMQLKPHYVENCLALSSDCVTCGEDTKRMLTTEMDENSLLFQPMMRLRCNLCLQYQHFGCSDKTSSHFLEALKKSCPDCATKNAAWRNAWNRTLSQYFDIIRKDFYCLDCADLVSGRASRCASIEYVDRSIGGPMGESQREELFARLYKENIAPFEKICATRTKRLDMLLMCRTVLWQASWYLMEVHQGLIQCGDGLTDAFKFSRKQLLRHGCNFENLLPYWLWQRGMRYLDIVQPTAYGKSSNEKIFLESLNSLLQNVLNVSSQEYNDRIDLLLSDGVFERVVQMAALASSFICFLLRLLAICGGSESRDNVYSAIHDRLILHSNESRRFLQQCFLEKVSELDALQSMYSLTGSVTVRDRSSEECPIKIQLRGEIKPQALRSGGVVPTQSNFGTENENSAHKDSILSYSDTKDPEKEIRKKRCEVSTLNVTSFTKRIAKESKYETLAKNAIAPTSFVHEAEIVNDFNQSNNGETCGLVLSTTVTESSLEPEVAVENEHQLLDHFLWSEDLSRYAICLSICFDKGILKDCPHGIPKVDYLCRKLCVDMSTIFVKLSKEVTTLNTKYIHCNSVDEARILEISMLCERASESCADLIRKNRIFAERSISQASSSAQSSFSKEQKFLLKLRSAEAVERRCRNAQIKQYDEFIQVFIFFDDNFLHEVLNFTNIHIGLHRLFFNPTYRSQCTPTKTVF